MINMNTVSDTVKRFVDATFEGRGFWGLTKGEEWVICDSAQFENADVLPLWSSESAAREHCVDEWEEYDVAMIPLEDFFEIWLNELNQDGVLIGCDWQLSLDGEEIDAMELAKLYQA
ncbi:MULTISPECIES: DUF2750 domain-containing protein [Ferrimonas]|uniref:DUF2750 domain-containing protein n=1 Tax=Ferrimonas TaxID=44011 RepID=UPI00041E9B3E|nr:MULTISPECIES: DUF2750 domain-containing protein [Ferrimonas]USD35680.1 DUF2750 domain-containing protein [Ferrimonas sp. SCSIO 43195]